MVQHLAYSHGSFVIQGMHLDEKYVENLSLY